MRVYTLCTLRANAFDYVERQHQHRWTPTDGRQLLARKRFRSSNKGCTAHRCMLTLPTASDLPYPGN